MDTIATLSAINDICTCCEQHLLAVLPERRHRRAAIMAIIVEFHRSVTERAMCKLDYTHARGMFSSVQPRLKILQM